MEGAKYLPWGKHLPLASKQAQGCPPPPASGLSRLATHTGWVTFEKALNHIRRYHLAWGCSVTVASCVEESQRKLANGDELVDADEQMAGGDGVPCCSALGGGDDQNGEEWGKSLSARRHGRMAMVFWNVHRASGHPATSGKGAPYNFLMIWHV
jgi:hypothetical protein